jgi:hypothetical protein
MGSEPPDIHQAAPIAGASVLVDEGSLRSRIASTADQTGEASFPASDPPATWTWDPDGRPPRLHR